MKTQNTTKLATTVASSVYQAPAIESIVTFENLQREVFYAGGGGGGGSIVPVPV